jgi:type III pantothenate kinase
MLLAIDIGNTHTVVGLFEGDELRHRWRMASDARRTSDEFGILIRELCGQSGVEFSDDPKEVGPDRLANAVAVHETIEGPVIVVDFGTATTFDVVTADGHYLGGAIAPGVVTSAESLFRRGALLPRVAVDAPPNVMGRTTEEAMRIVFGAVGQVDEIVRRIIEEWGESPSVIATGGLAGTIAAFSKTIESVEPDLTLTGLVAIHRKVAGA